MFKTNDFRLITTLSVLGHNYSETEVDGREVHFFYEETPALQEAIDSYHARQVQVEPQRYETERFMLKKNIDHQLNAIK